LASSLFQNRLTMSEWFCFKIQTRHSKASTLLRSRRLFQQFIVDGYTMIEFERLSFIRNNKSKLRVDKWFIIWFIRFFIHTIVMRIQAKRWKFKTNDYKNIRLSL